MPLTISDEKLAQLRAVAEHPVFVDGFPLLALFLSLWAETARFPEDLRLALEKRDEAWRDEITVARKARDTADAFVTAFNVDAVRVGYIGEILSGRIAAPVDKSWDASKEGEFLQALAKKLAQSIAHPLGR